MNLTDLNEQQKEAVTYTNGPLLILAGAGSGKTRVLTYKVAYLIKELGISPFSILAITFTNKAAKEMKERVYNLIGKEANNIQISTFHSFGYRVIRENYQLLNLMRNFIILDESDSVSTIKKVLHKLNLDPKHYNPIYLRKIISGVKNELLSVSEYAKFCHTEWEQTVLKIYAKYEQMLEQNNAVDFDDLLIKPINIFKKNNEVLNHYQEQFKYILIDEYQDTNEAQYVLIKLIGAKYKNVFVVGDADQSIYSFRGANYNNILHFEKDYNNAKTIILESNYRSTKNILEAANNVIKNNKIRKEKKLVTTCDEGSKIKYFQGYNEKDEGKYITDEIKKLYDEGVSYNEMAVLYRTNAQSRALEDAFMVSNIPYQVVGAFAFYNRKEIKDLFAYLKLIYNEKDDISLLRCINTPRRGIGKKKQEKLIEQAEMENKSIYEVIKQEPELSFKKTIEELKEINKNSNLITLIESVLTKSGLRDFYVNQKNLEADIKIENMEEIKSVIKSLEENHGYISLEEFLMQISLVSNSEELKDINDKVSLMTVHAVKGLEFNTVFITGLEEQIFPHANSLDSNSDIEEERRLFYVAMTRAKRYLYLSNAKLRLLFGDHRFNVASRFIAEIGDEFIEEINDNNSFDYKNMFYSDSDY